MRAVCSFLSIALLCTAVSGYPYGAPPETCRSMRPIHGRQAQAGSGGYRIFVEPKTATKWRVTLNGTSPFLGFLLEARSTNGENIVGRWSRLPPWTRKLDCGGLNGNAVTHNNSDRKKMKNLSFTWTASSCKEAPVYFRATVVRLFTEIYEDITSDVLNDVCLRPSRCKECGALTRAEPQRLVRRERARCRRAAVRANKHAHRQHDIANCWRRH